MALLSINLNKFALIRNARGTNKPDLIDICKRCIIYGAGGITVHPRPDERHVKFADLMPLLETIKKMDINIEFNIEGYPSKKFCDTVNKIKPDQITLVPDPPEAITSSIGWDCEKNKKFLIEVVNEFKKNGIRVSLFINPSTKTLENLYEIKPDRIELYTHDYALKFEGNPKKSVEPYINVAKFIKDIPNIGINAGHDLNLNNLDFLLKNIPSILEVSIGHALVCESLLEFGLKNTIAKYLSITSNN